MDGELIFHSKKDEHLNHFACFDAYARGNVDVTALPLLGNTNSRLHHARDVIQGVVSARVRDAFTAQVKTFFRVELDGLATRTVLDLAEHTYPYNTDGLVFTPAELPVGGRFQGDECAIDGTWYQLLKWKPRDFSTVDVVVKRNNLGDVDGHRVFTMLCSYVPRDWEPVDVMRYVRFKDRALPSDVAIARPFDPAGDLKHLHVPLDDMGRPLARDKSVIYDNDVVVRPVVL